MDAVEWSAGEKIGTEGFVYIYTATQDFRYLYI